MRKPRPAPLRSSPGDSSPLVQARGPPTPRGTDGYRAPSLQARGAPSNAARNQRVPSAFAAGAGSAHWSELPAAPPPRLMQAHGGAHASRRLTLEERSASCRRGGRPPERAPRHPLPQGSCRRGGRPCLKRADTGGTIRFMQARGPPSKRTTPAQRGLNQRLVAGRVEARLSTFHPCRRLHHQPEPGARACRQRQLRW